MKTTMIKGTLAGLAAIGLAVGAQAQSVGFGLSFGSAGLNSFGFSYAGGNFGIGVGFNAYSPWYYPYYPYYGYTWPAYSTFYWGPTWSSCYPSCSWYSPACYYPGWYGCHYPYWGYGGYCGYNSGYYYNSGGYYHNNYPAYHNAGYPNNGGYAHGGGSGYVTQGPGHVGMSGAGSPGYQRVFSSAYWDQPHKGIPTQAPHTGVAPVRTPVWNQPGAIPRGPGYQRVVSTSPTFNPGTHAIGTYPGHQPGPVTWNGNGSRAAQPGSGPAGSRPVGFSSGNQPVRYSPSWYHPGNPGTTVSMNNGSRPFNGRPVGNVNPGNQAFGAGSRPSNGHFQPPTGFGGSHPTGSFAGARPAPRGGFGGGAPAPHGGLGGGAPVSHGGFHGGQMAQGPSMGGMGGGHAFGGFHH